MSPKPRVLLDVDGVICDFIGGVLDLVAAITGRRHTHEDVREFDFCAALGLARDEASSVKHKIAMSGFCASLKPFPDARHGVRRLAEVADIYVVTSPWNSNPTWTSERESWLKRHFEIPHSRVLHGSAKHLVDGDFLVDDKGDTLGHWAAAHPLGHAVHWDTPHNRRELVIGATRVTSWNELVDLVTGAST